ncbi:hypothetical protein JCM17960_19320 [Magnetospira thiophila]
MYTHMNFTGKGFIGSTKTETRNGTNVGTLRIAKTDTWKDRNDGEKKERTSWFTVTVFAPGLLDMIDKGWLAKGRYIEVTGDLRENRWTKDDKEFSEVQLVADTIRFLDRKPEE